MNNRLLSHPIRQYLIALAVMVWLTMLIYALVKNPSITDASEKMTMMKADMATLLTNGGNVVYRSENAKFGGALLSVLIRMDSWSQQLREQDIRTLTDLGWQHISTNPYSFCKQGMLADIQENVGDYKNIASVYISMKYNATTVKTCK